MIGETGEGGEVGGGLGKGGAIETLDKGDDVAAGVATGETMPEILGKGDDKGGGVVATMKRTGSNETVSASGK